MKLFILLIFAIINSLNCASQERSEPTSFKYLNKTWELKQAIGWAKDSATQQWFSRINVIPGRRKGDETILEFDKKIGLDNFFMLSMHKVSLNSKEYLLLLRGRRFGFYEYPTIKQDWKEANRITYYVLDPAIATPISEQLKEVDTSVKHFEFAILYTGTVDYNSTFSTVKLVSKIFESDKSSGMNLHIVIQPNPRKNRVRFLITDIYEGGFYGYSLCDYCHEIFPYEQNLFGKYYFESSFSSLKGLVKY